MRRSNSMGTVSPAPTAAPLMAPMTGVRIVQNAERSGTESESTPWAASWAAWGLSPHGGAVDGADDRRAHRPERGALGHRVRVHALGGVVGGVRLLPEDVGAAAH